MVLKDNLKQTLINDVKSLLKTQDKFTKEEVNYLLACMYDRVRKVNTEILQLSAKIIQDIIEFQHHLDLVSEKARKEKGK